MSTLMPGPKKEKLEGASGLRSQATKREISPKYKADYFTCPRCGVASAQRWIDLHTVERVYGNGSMREVTTKLADIGISQCGTCSARSLWFEAQLVFPETHDAPPMSPDMPPDLQRDYEEAAAIASASPRAAAALLRMCIEGLCKKITGAETFDKAIATLQQQHIPPEIQLAMDVIRQNGNEVLHAGQLYGDDDASTVAMLFRLVNTVVTWAITEKRELQELYNQIPEAKRKHLEERRKKEIGAK